MRGHVETPQAWGLARGMARAIGLDLVGAVSEGWLARGDLADMVEVCEACDQAGRCMEWLGSHPLAETLPGFCHNKHSLEALQP